MRTIRRFARTRYWPALALTLAALVLLAAPGGGARCGSVHASDTLPSDYCNQMDITITYTGASTLTHQAVRVPLSALGLIANNQMDTRAWDIRPIQGSLSNEVDVLAQEISSSSAPFWIHVPELVQDQTKTVRLYLGSPEQKRNQGILFTGSDSLAAVDDVVMDISDNLTLDVELELLDDTPVDATLASHFNASGIDGYRFRLIDVAGTLRIEAQADAVFCLLNWDSSWTNVNQLFTMRFAADPGTDLFIDRNGVNEAACDTDLAAITAPAGSPSFIAGNTLAAGIIRDIRLLNGSTVVADWGFDPLSIVEDTASDPTYTGTIQDYGPNDLDFTYTFTRSQTGLSHVVGAVQLASGAQEISLSTDTVNIIGSGFGGDIATPIAENTTGIGFEFFAGPIADVVGTSGPRDMGYAIAMGGLGVVLALWMFKATKFTPLALFVGGVPPAIGMINGWIPAWWMLLWAILVIGSWFSIRQQEQA